MDGQTDGLSDFSIHNPGFLINFSQTKRSLNL